MYTLPRDPADFVNLMSGHVRFMNDPDLLDVDPLIKMALLLTKYLLYGGDRMSMGLSLASAPI